MKFRLVECALSLDDEGTERRVQVSSGARFLTPVLHKGRVVVPALVPADGGDNATHILHLVHSGNVEKLDTKVALDGHLGSVSSGTVMFHIFNGGEQRA